MGHGGSMAGLFFLFKYLGKMYKNSKRIKVSLNINCKIRTNNCTV